MKEKVSVIKESYNNYRFKNDRYKVSADYREYSMLAQAFFNNLFKAIVTTGLEYPLPSRLGTFIIEKYSVEKFDENLKKEGKRMWKTDINSEKRFEEEYGFRKEIRYDTDETDGFMWVFSWLKNEEGVFTNKKYYSFELVRSNIRNTSNKEYSERSNRLTVHTFFKEKGHKLYRTLVRRIIKNKLKSNAQNSNDSSGINT